MYFPYLQNRQSERQALKALINKNKLDNVTPILVTSFIDTNIELSNPEEVNKYIVKNLKIVKDFAKDNQNFILLFDNSLSMANLSFQNVHDILIRGLDVDRDVFESLCTYGVNDFDLQMDFISSFAQNNSIAVFYNREPQIYTGFNIKYHILLNQDYILEFLDLSVENKIVITDSFKTQSSNKDYPSYDEFVSYALKYKKHNLHGFGDYTILGSGFTPPRQVNMNNVTVAIHVTFANQENKIYVAHYLCEPYQEPAFSERVACALGKMKNDLDRFEKTIGITSFLNVESTNLAKLKELSITHHIEFMSQY